MDEISLQQTEAEARRRKVRKGTHSCWECRRRKIRCQFGAGDDAVCLPCQARGSMCRSQEYLDSSPPQIPDRRLAQRLAHLEELMAKVVDRVMPEARSGASSTQNLSRHASPTASNYTASGSVDDDDAGYGTPSSLRLGSHPRQHPNHHYGMPARAASADGTGRRGTGRDWLSKKDEISQALHNLFPPQQDVDAISKLSAGRYFAVSLFGCYRDQIEGRCENPDSLSVIPSPSSHPTVLARRLLQLCICIQYEPAATRDIQPLLQIRVPLLDHSQSIVSFVGKHVTDNDDLVATAEGLQALILLGCWHVNQGNPRTAWLTFRRAISLGILIGIDRPSSPAPANQLEFADPITPLATRPTPQALWYRINSYDRILSLMLDLPVGSHSNSFATEASMARDTPQERLARLHTVVARRIIERNTMLVQHQAKASSIYATTSQTDRELEGAARAMSPEWWTIPSLDSPDPAALFVRANRLLMQIHHFELRNMLHLPHTPWGPAKPSYSSPEGQQYEVPSSSTCYSASREILQRFIAFRSASSTAGWSNRQADHSGFVAAMTILLRHLHVEHDETVEAIREREEDRKLVEIARERMQHVAVVNKDKFCRECADAISQMLPVLLSSPDEQEDGQVARLVACEKDCDCTNQSMDSLKQCLSLNVPYFGLLRMHPLPAGGSGPPHRRKNVETGGGGGHGEYLHERTTQNFSAAGATGSNTIPRVSQMHLDYSIDPALGDHPHGGGFQPHPHTHGGMNMRYDTNQQANGGMTEMHLTNAPEDWVFQGIESSYWDLMNRNGMQG
ncbi:transcription factor sdnS [Cladorrhinum samala]|uniref:Transcription factor sdnS n=1 Tax=Cladorrhinum samala TaxID=585594 RepID=A0AAV9I5P9_9PEZI|nr:transcription factor sdnS [Cladorrhinum samala]